MLATKNSESLPENKSGWRPYYSWLRHWWVCRGADYGSKVRSGNGLPLIAPCRLMLVLVSTPLRL